jgi:hypothetical protein
LPSGAENPTDLPSGTGNATDLPSGTTNTIDLPAGATSTTGLPSGAPNTTDLPAGATSTSDLPSGATSTSDLPSGATNTTDWPSGATNTTDWPSCSTVTTEMIFGSFYQGDARFSTFSRGSQCTCMALTMLLKCYEGYSFTSEFLDQVVIAGDQIYKTVIESLQKQKKIQHKLLKFDELPQNVTLGENHHLIQKFDTIWGLAVCEEQVSHAKTLHQSIAEGFEISRYLLIMLGSICSALYKISSSEYYFFDSHSHSVDGMSCSDGKSILVRSKNLDDTVMYLYSMYESMHIDLGTQFEILPVAIQTLYHSFPDNNPSERNYYRLDDKSPTVSSIHQIQNRKKYKREYMKEYMKKKRQRKKFRESEKIKDASARNVARKNEYVRHKEMERDKSARQFKRQNVEIKEGNIDS